MRVSTIAPSLALALGLGACERPPDPPATDATPVATPAPPVAGDDAGPVETLAGGWRVTGIDDEDFDEAYGLAFYATDTLFYWDPACAGQERLYTIDGTDFSAETVESEAPPILCEAILPDRLPEVWRAFDNARAIEPTAEGGVRISGGGYSVTLLRQ